MTGDAPQPAEPPQDDHGGTSWWHSRAGGDAEPVAGAELAGAASPRPRRPRRRPPLATPPPAPPAETTPAPPPAAFAPEALDAHAAGAQDATTAFETPPAVRLEAELHETIEQAEDAAAARTVADARGDDDPPPEPASPADGVPDVMVLPEPNRNRPTVVLEPRPAPARPPGQADQAARDAARLRMENHPFWMSDEQRAAEPAAETPPGTAPAGLPAQPREPRRPVPGLIGLVALGLVAAFFAWVSAEPFWLAVGHGDRGTATVDACTGSGVTQRCAGTFTASDGSFTVHRVALQGVSEQGRATGTAAPARMVSADSRQAYLGGAGPLMHLRWVLGFVLVVLCGYGIAGSTGARHLDTPRARRNAVLISVAGPLLLLVGFLVAAY